MLKVLSEAGNHVKDEVWHALIVVITNASNLHGYTVRSLYKAIQTSGDQETLVRVAVWCIGEYADMLVNGIRMLDLEDPITVTENDAVDVVEAAIKRHSSDLTTRAMCLIALLDAPLAFVKGLKYLLELGFTAAKKIPHQWVGRAVFQECDLISPYSTTNLARNL